MRRAALCVPLCFYGALCVAVGDANASPRCAVMVLPTRSDAASALHDRTARIASEFAKRMGGRVVPARPPLQLDDRFSQGRALARQGKLDDAATILDGALDQGARAPDRVKD